MSVSSACPLPRFTMTATGTITRLLNAADAQDSQAADELYRLVKDDLQRIARQRKRVVGVEIGLDAVVAQAGIEGVQP